jgi:hypothetical protein
MGKLHQHLAVEPDIKGREEKVRKECIKTFKDRQSHFDGFVETFKPVEENKTDEVEKEKHVVETVQSKLDYVQGSIIKLIDFVYQKELANTTAKADIKVEDEEGKEHELGKDVPATVLLNLESRLKDIRSIYDSIPTCDPAKKWFENKNAANQYITNPEKRTRTKKTPKPIVLHPPTKEHPAQTQLIHEDIETGKLEIIHMTGRLTPAQKSKLLGRIDDLIQAVKKARQRANDVDMSNVKIGKELFNYIHGE